jgi:cysteine-rich repeat protein
MSRRATIACRRAAGARCGDVVHVGVEACDTEGVRRRRAVGSCDDDCTPAQCGDGALNLVAGEQCDNHRAAPTAPTAIATAATPCAATASVNMQAGEQCDDGNNDPGDTCSPLCTLEQCGNMVRRPRRGLRRRQHRPERCVPPRLPVGQHVRQRRARRSPAAQPRQPGAVPRRHHAAHRLRRGLRRRQPRTRATAAAPTACPRRRAATASTTVTRALHEVCDDGDLGDDACRDDCQGGAGCGNGLVDGGEQCDGKRRHRQLRRRLQRPDVRRYDGQPAGRRGL